MTAFRHRLKSLAWLALLAMCGVALGPSISRALSPRAAASSVCTHEHPMEMGSHGHMVAGSEAGHSDAPVDLSCVLDCCALCAVAASAFTGAAVFTAQWQPVEPGAPAQADGFIVRNGEREVWSSASPRGPPHLS